MLTTPHELVTALAWLVLAVLSWVGKDAIRKQESLMDKLNVHASALEVLRSSAVPSRVDHHEQRLRTLEMELADVAADVKVVRQILETSPARRR